MPFRTLAESWNGTGWSLVASPQPGDGDSLNGVSCTSAAACVAVGGYTNDKGTSRPFIEAWNGSTWSVVPSHSPHPRPNELFGVSCASATACTATGYYVKIGGATRTLIESGTASAG